MEKFRYVYLFFEKKQAAFFKEYAFLLCAFIFINQVCFSQTDRIKNIQLKDFQLIDKKVDQTFSQSLFSVGTAIQIADSSVLSQLQHSNLSDYLLQNSAVFIKESGNGMLSTISIRGTASSHTTVSWNGLTINPLTMGQVDFSQLPLFFFDKVALHPGGESSLYGNGAIGGSIILGTEHDYKKSFHGEIQQTVGSYDYTFSGIKLHGGTEKIQSKTMLMYNQCANDFTIKQASFSGISTQQQQNASFYRYGFLQDFAVKLSPKNELTFSAWHTYFYREIQPSIQNNLDTALYDNISNRNTLLLVKFTRKSSFNWESSLAYIKDYQLNIEDVIASQQLFVSADGSKNWRNYSLKTGFSGQYIVPQVYSFNKGIKEFRGDVYALSRWQPNSAWKITCNLRQALVTDIAVPFTPSAGVEARLLQLENSRMHVRYNISRSYKVPTLNDRYWGGLDNRYLQPEDGLNNELGLNYGYTNNGYNFQTNVSVYYNRVKNWIMWMPRGDIWKPQNVDEVEAKGLDIHLKQTYSLQRFKISLLVNYAFTQTFVLEGFTEMTPFKGRQMPLLPEHTAMGLFQVDYNRFFAAVNAHYVGERTTSNVFESMHAYVLFNCSAGYNLKLKKNQLLAFSVKGNNLFGVTYQTVPYKAMPLQNWSAGLQYKF
ncbi:MAG: TonB-dependent receptor plug domain-containing protein [Paludibacteraceae bacterium]|nr:TonB-dependent receptor plug domain-containing protein [Paludibacteraceae bacterium]MBN2787978.1 TonB-dependent receptor plug domain-containing protein [Paludibacteraceae bacterium]